MNTQRNTAKFSLALILILCMSFGRCKLDLALVDWHFADEVPLGSFPKDLTGEYSAMYSSKLLSGKVNCGQDELLIQEKNLKLSCGGKLLASCLTSSIVQQGRNYKIHCLLPSRLGEKEAFQGTNLKQFTINYVSYNKIAIVDDISHSLNRLYHKRDKISDELN